MILSFKPQFVDPILNGTKIHTIREDSTDRWKAGNSIQCATGVRSKNYNCFFESECVSTQEIFMTYAHNDILEISIDGRYLYWEDRNKLALNDGFEDWQDFFNWFHPIIMESKSKSFVGKIIHWTDFRY